MSGSETHISGLRRFQPLTVAAIVAIHLAALLAFFPYFFSWGGLILALFMAWGTASLGASLTYHRMLSHRAWQPVPWLRTMLLSFAALSLQSGPVRWAATHRLHHRESDHEDDPHSPLVSFLWAHIGWLFYSVPRVEDPAELRKLAPDLLEDPELLFFQRWFGTMWVAFALLSFGAGYLIGGGGADGLRLGLSLLVWGSFARTVWVWHCTWFVNSVTHLFGYRNYNTEDESRNLWWVAFLTYGEGWHNNHHAIAGSARFGQKWWEFDPTWWALSAFQRAGWVRKVTVAPLLSNTAAVREYAGKSGARSPRLLRRPERLALRLLRRCGNSPALLIAALHNRRSTVREAAALALGEINIGAQQAVDALTQALSDRSERVHDAALRALQRRGLTPPGSTAGAAF